MRLGGGRHEGRYVETRATTVPSSVDPRACSRYIIGKSGHRAHTNSQCYGLCLWSQVRIAGGAREGAWITGKLPRADENIFHSPPSKARRIVFKATSFTSFGFFGFLGSGAFDGEGARPWAWRARVDRICACAQNLRSPPHISCLKKENGQPKGGMGGRHAATTQGF